MDCKLYFSVVIEASQEELFSYYETEAALYRMSPPWENISVVHKDKGLEVGGIVHVKIGRKNWISKTVVSERPCRFEAEQVVGPFQSMHHKHLLTKITERQTEIVDEITYTPKYGKWCRRFLIKYIEKKVTRMMEYRHRVLREDFRQMKLSTSIKNKKVLITGSSGFIGKHLKAILDLFGCEVYSLVRKKSVCKNEIYWDPYKRIIDKDLLEGFDAVIHLSGKNVFSRWTKKQKKKILESRIQTTLFLTNTLNQLYYTPKTFICASAIAFYGDCGNQIVDESSSKGIGFLSDVVELWEKSAQNFTKGRVVCGRFGVVLGLNGGILKNVLFLFKLGLGAVIGKGSEQMSWISIDDLAYQIAYVLAKPEIQGIVNFTSPETVTSKEFATVLAAVLKRKVFLRIPPALIKALFGEISSLFLMSAKVLPKKLLESGAYFSYHNLVKTLRHYLSFNP